MNCKSSALSIGASSYVNCTCVFDDFGSSNPGSTSGVVVKSLRISAFASRRARVDKPTESKIRSHKRASSSSNFADPLYVFSEVRKRKNSSIATRVCFASSPMATCGVSTISTSSPPVAVSSFFSYSNARSGKRTSSFAAIHPPRTPVHVRRRRHALTGTSASAEFFARLNFTVTSFPTLITCANRHVDGISCMTSMISPARKSLARKSSRGGTGRATHVILVGRTLRTANRSCAGIVATPLPQTSSFAHTKNSPRTLSSSYSTRARGAALKFAETTEPTRQSSGATSALEDTSTPTP
mmetsp:Transcript_3432/g.13303  ORF Transcript_3432/g.13303 Transcript_3432/m.13303 type:complete len:298 (+) Transcript_3432:894-1787(+)